uniref:HCLS1-binding protein 3-like protein n=1 Tax=Callorhinchus milii TaxID=7868 RepID=V9L0P6_CALMI
MSEATVTSRAIQNLNTGIDLSVPEYQEIHGKMMSGHVEYQIVVVTQLASFKSAKHKPRDVVQLVVSKKYSEIDALHQKLGTQYPQASLPPMPRKVLFVGESAIKERRATFDEIFRSISKDKTLVTSPELLAFLGAKGRDLGDLKSRNVTDEQQEDEGEFGDFFNQEATKDAVPFKHSETYKTATEQIVEMADPLGVTSYRVKKTETPAKKATHKLTLFEEVDADAGLFDPVESSTTQVGKKSTFSATGFRLFEDPDLDGAVRSDDPLLLPTTFEHRIGALSTDLNEDTEELLRVEDDLDKILKLRSSSKAKPKVPTKPAIPNKAASSPAPDVSPAPVRSTENPVDSMNEMDILKYIQQNEASGSEALDLF